MARGSVQRRFLQRLRGSALALDYSHGVAETSPLSEIAGAPPFEVKRLASCIASPLGSRKSSRGRRRGLSRYRRRGSTLAAIVSSWPWPSSCSRRTSSRLGPGRCAVRLHRLEKTLIHRLAFLVRPSADLFIAGLRLRGAAVDAIAALRQRALVAFDPAAHRASSSGGESTGEMTTAIGEKIHGTARNGPPRWWPARGQSKLSADYGHFTDTK